ncbi:MAG: hypothetical protein N2B06_17245 [Clostridium sp.]
MNSDTLCIIHYKPGILEEIIKYSVSKHGGEWYLDDDDGDVYRWFDDDDGDKGILLWEDVSKKRIYVSCACRIQFSCSCEASTCWWLYEYILVDSSSYSFM